MNTRKPYEINVILSTCTAFFISACYDFNIYSHDGGQNSAVTAEDADGAAVSGIAGGKSNMISAGGGSVAPASGGSGGRSSIAGAGGQSIAPASGASGDAGIGLRCQNDSACGQAEYCNQEHACVARQADGNQCGRDRQCEPGFGCCNKVCISLSQTSHCGISGGADATTCGVDCDDHQFCTGNDTCTGGACVHSGNPCDDACAQCNELTDSCISTFWSEKSPAISPPAVYLYAMGALRTKAVLFGGYDGNAGGICLNDTWEWDGSNWSQKSPAVSPPRRAGHAMAASGTKIVLFGGSDAEKYLNDTWEWDGSNWSQKSPTTSPSARYEHAMAALGTKVVLFGGHDRGGSVLNETWEWDGSNWSEKSLPTSPSTRWGNVMATFKGKVVLFGGYYMNDIWELGGCVSDNNE
jgi:hypothetical protein